MPAEKDKDFFSVIYAVMYLPIRVDTKTDLTFRLSAKNKDPLNLYKFYSNYYNTMNKNSNLLYEFEYGNNMWDFSSEEWDKFEENYHVYSQVMEDLIKFGEIFPHHNILDIGCGTGQTSQKLVNKIENGSLLLLDKSPRMIEKAKKLLGANGKVKFILADVKKKNPLYGTFQNAKFHRIVVHFCFQHFIDNSCSIQLFAKNWKRYLEKDGDILIAIHNSFIECPLPNGYDDKWADPLRDELKAIARGMGLTVKDDSHDKFTLEEIKNEFENAGFYLKEKISHEYPRTMEDRIALWKVPAVIDSLLDIKNDHQIKSKIIDTVRQRVVGENTKPTTVVFFKFSLKDKIET